MTIEELWRPIPNYEGYEASNLGRIRSIDRHVEYIRFGKLCTQLHHGKILNAKYTSSRSKISYVFLSKGHRKNFICRIDRLIAATWVPNPDNFQNVVHLDFDIQNNRADNLDWAPYHYKHPIESNNMKEEWRPIPDFEDLYEISNAGKIRSIARTSKNTRNSYNKTTNYVANYQPKELKPYRIRKKTNTLIYHLHRRYKSGYYGQTDLYISSEELMRLVFPELYEEEVR